MNVGNNNQFENDDFSGFSSGDIDVDFLGDEYAPKDANNETIEPIQKVARNEQNKSLLNFESSLQIGDESPLSIIPQAQQSQKSVKNDAKVNNNPIDLKSFLQTPVGSIADLDDKSNTTGSRLLIKKTIDKAQDKSKPKTNIFPISLNESSSINFDLSSSQVSNKNNSNGNLVDNSTKVSQFTLPGIPVLSNDHTNNLPPLSDKSSLNTKPQTNVKTIKVNTGNTASTVVNPSLNINQNSINNSNSNKPNEEAKSASITVPVQTKSEGNSIKVSIKPRWATKQQSELLQKQKSQQNQQISPSQQPTISQQQSSVQSQAQQVQNQQIQNPQSQQQTQNQDQLPIQQNQPQMQNHPTQQQNQIQQSPKSQQSSVQQSQPPPQIPAQQNQPHPQNQSQIQLPQSQTQNQQNQIQQNPQPDQQQLQKPPNQQQMQNTQPQIPTQQQQQQAQQQQKPPNQQQIPNTQPQIPIQQQQQSQQHQKPPNQQQIPNIQPQTQQNTHSQVQTQQQQINQQQQQQHQNQIQGQQFQFPIQSQQQFPTNYSPTQNLTQPQTPPLIGQPNLSQTSQQPHPNVSQTLQYTQPNIFQIDQTTQQQQQLILHPNQLLPPNLPLYNYQPIDQQLFSPLAEHVNFSVSASLDNSFSSIRRSVASELSSVLRRSPMSSSPISFDVDNFISSLNNDLINALSFASPPDIDSNSINNNNNQQQPFSIPLNSSDFDYNYKNNYNYNAFNFNMNLNLNLNRETIRNGGYQTLLHSFQKDPMLLRPLARGINAAIDQEIKPLSVMMKDSIQEKNKIKAENVEILQNLLNQVESMRITCKNFGDEIIRELEREELMVASRRDLEVVNCNKKANKLREMKLQFVEFESKAKQQEIELRKNSELFDRLKQQIEFFLDKSNKKFHLNGKNGRGGRNDQDRSDSNYEFEQILDEINDIETEIQNDGYGHICGEFENLSKCFQNDKNNMKDELLNIEYFNQKLLSRSKLAFRNNNNSFFYNQNQVPPQYNQNHNSNSSLYPNSSLNISKQNQVNLNSNFQNKMADANKKINSYRMQRDSLAQSNLA